MPLLPGQRWISTAEPELGLGTLLRVEGRSAQLLFTTAGVLRQYALHSAPLIRANFRVGQSVSGKGISFIIEQVEEDDGLLIYHGRNDTLHEAELDDTQTLSHADERLLSGRVDRHDLFDLRLEALQRRADMLASPAAGLASARIDLIDHQLRVAEQALSRQPLRALLADEVGLGKTIEAGMILCRLLAAGRVRRVLILVPDSLQHQWLVELSRRFNLDFTLLDENRCQALQEGDPAANPCQQVQLVLTSIGFASAERADQFAAADWDLVIIDEAHHLEWQADGQNAQYSLAEQLAQRCPNLLLLTATPEQLGRQGHFARLRLLDPARFHDLDQYIAEAEGYVGLSHVADQLAAGGELDGPARQLLAERFADDPELLELLDADDNDRLLDALIDRHGTGRVMFRNRRANMDGFPPREPRLQVLAGELDEAGRAMLLAEFEQDRQHGTTSQAVPDYHNDPRLPWLLQLLEESGTEKLLLICRSAAKVQALEDALRARSGVQVARFHEGLTLLQRDRNAAWFAEPDGARLLLCSEIGSEGRNFQFAHQLVMWDLPFDPDLLEQRIGRLDRIGQKRAIQIHAAAFDGTAQQALLRWYNEGLDAFRRAPDAGRQLLREFGARLATLAVDHAQQPTATQPALQSLIDATHSRAGELTEQVQQGRDRLLDLASARRRGNNGLGNVLRRIDADLARDTFILRLFEHFGVEGEDIDGHTVLLDPQYLNTDGFVGLDDGPQTVTFDRATALVREDLPLLRLDHPMVSGALDLLLESETGNAAFVADTQLPPRSALLECIFVIVCVADQTLPVERFLPPLPLRVVVDSRLQDRADYSPQRDPTHSSLRDVDAIRHRGSLAKVLPPLLAHAQTLAEARLRQKIGDALAETQRHYRDEQSRLQALARINPAVQPAELQALADELSQLDSALPGAVLRLDSLRFTCSADFLQLR